MAKSAWNAYKQFAMGKGTLSPLTNSSAGGDNYSGKSIIAALGTFKIMGLETEYNEARKWLVENWKFESVAGTFGDSFVFNQISEYLGGLLSAYALSNDQVFLNKATEIVDAIESGGVYNTSTGLPLEFFVPKTKKANDDFPPLVTVGGTFLELLYYAKAANKQAVKERVYANRRYLKARLPANGLYGIALNVSAKNVNETDKSEKSSEFYSSYNGLDWNSNDFYRALLLTYIQSNGSDTEALAMYSDAVEALIREKYIVQQPNGAVMIHCKKSKEISPQKVSNLYLNCQWGGLLVLGAQTLKKANYSVEIADRHQQLGLQIAEDCHEASNRTTTKLGPFKFIAQSYLPSENAKHYRLTPNYAETNFVLWRLTGDVKYRDRAFKMSKAIYQNAQTASGGFSSIKDVTVKNEKDNEQPAEFLSGTLKFLYLTFSKPETLPLNKWVFNSFGHAFPVLSN